MLSLGQYMFEKLQTGEKIHVSLETAAIRFMLKHLQDLANSTL